MYFILNVCYIPFIPLSSKPSTFFQIFRGRNGRNEFLPLSSTRPEESHFFRKKLNPDIITFPMFTVHGQGDLGVRVYLQDEVDSRAPCHRKGMCVMVLGL